MRNPFRCRSLRGPDVVGDQEESPVGDEGGRPRWPRRMSRKAEMELIKQLPRAQKLILISKVSAVVLFAIGLEGLFLGNWWMAGGFILLGILFTIWPIKMNMPNICPRCRQVVRQDQALCDNCGVALM